MQLIRFIFSKVFLINLVIAIGVISGAIWGTFQGLNAYTNHGETITVPDMKGLTIEQVERLLDDKYLNYVVHDSTYVVDKLSGVVLEQDPAPKEKVKEKRKIYLTINANNPPKVDMPDLQDKSLRQAKMELASKGLKVGELTYEPDLAQNAVLKQKHNGQEIKPEDQIAKGSKVDLVLGDGLGDTEVDVPKLVGLTYEEARFNLIGNSLNVGAIELEENIKDTLSAYVVKQIPSYEGDNTLNLGESVDLYLSESFKDNSNTKKVDTTRASSQRKIDSLIESELHR